MICNIVFSQGCLDVGPNPVHDEFSGGCVYVAGVVLSFRPLLFAVKREHVAQVFAVSREHLEHGRVKIMRPHFLLDDEALSFRCGEVGVVFHWSEKETPTDISM